jgi:hypothetical protein
VALFGAGTQGLLRVPCWVRLVARDLGESAMQALAKLVGWIVLLRTTVASHHDARRGHPGEPSKPDQLPAHAHSRVG